MKLEKNDIILFNGDSITDCGRDRADFHSLAGYNLMVKNYLDNFCGQLNIKVFNRGIGGEVSYEMLARLEKELKETKATVLSILIGVNDAWRSFENPSPTNDDDFRNHMEEIFKLSKKYVKKIIILEPFLLTSYCAYEVFYKELIKKICIVRECAVKFEADFIPLDGIFAENCCVTEAKLLSADGIHPTFQGNALIAKEWLKRVI